MVRTYRKRYSRKRSAARKSLSTAKIFGKTSAKSQARQIYALRKAVSSLNRRFRPEIKTLENWGGPTSQTLTSGTLSDSYFRTYFQWPAVGSNEGARVGDKIRLKSLQFGVQMEYYNNSATGYHDSESAGTPVRVIVVRTREQLDPSYPPALSDILKYGDYSGDYYTARATSPYVHGINDTYKVCYDKLCYLTITKNQKCLRIFLGPKTITWNKTGNKAIHYFLFVAPTGLHWDTNFKEYVQVVATGKIAYTDF